MRSQLYYLCLLAVYVAASPLQRHPRHAPPVYGTALHLNRDGRHQVKRAPVPTSAPLKSSRRAVPIDDDECEDDTTSYASTTTRVIPVTATKTKTFNVTATRTASKTSTRVSTSTSTKTVTKNVPKPTQKTTTSKKTSTTSKATTKTTSKAASTSAATTTLTTLVVPIPTSKNYVFKGMSSWYYTGLGACGWWSNDGEMVAAVPDHVYDNFPGATPEWNTNGNPVCGNKIDITWGGKTIRVTVVDRCVGCQTYQIDLSPTAFGALADGDLDRGLLYDITWQWV